ncbi:MAG: prenyltransferase [Eubacteriales bacterium]|nr:prenyltransferase [Eubacteriales bacterium]
MKKWIQAIRLSVLTASVLPAVLGAVYAYYEKGIFLVWPFILTLLGIALIHTGANLINDYFDYKSGADTQNQEYLPGVTGGSRVVVDGFIPLKTVLNVAIATFVLGTAIGVYLAIIAGPVVYWLIGFGLLTSVIYTTPRFNLINMKLGEIVIGLDFGILTILGAYYVQTGTFSLNAFFVSIPVGILIAAILLINEFQDYQSDLKVGKKTTVVRIGRKAGSQLLTTMLISLQILVLVDVILGALPLWSLLSLLSAPLLFQSIQVAKKHFDQPTQIGLSNMSLIMGQLVMLLLLTVSILIPNSLYYLIALIPVLLLDFKAMQQTGVL